MEVSRIPPRFPPNLASYLIAIRVARYLRPYRPVADFTKASDVDRLVHQQRNAAYEVLKRFLRRQGYSQSTNAEAGPRGSDVQPG